MKRSTQPAVAEIDPKRGSGGPLVVGLVALGLGLACFAIWFQWQQTRRCLTFYGSDAARRIQSAARVELWEPRGSAAATPDGLESAARTDISRAPGLVHLRRGLVEDANFDWRRDVGAGAGWDAALAFYDSADAPTPATILVIDFDPAGGSIALAGDDRRVGLGRIEKGIRAWLGAVPREK